MNDIPHKPFEIPIFQKFILYTIKKIYGDEREVSVFEGIDTQTGERVAFKLVNEACDEKSCLKNGAKLLKFLNTVERIPKFLYNGKQGKYYILIMNLLGPSLQRLMEYCQGDFSFPTTLKIFIQLLDILKQIHDKGVLIRYLKPENMSIGIGENKKYIYINDFGLAKPYIKSVITQNLEKKKYKRQ